MNDWLPNWLCQLALVVIDDVGQTNSWCIYNNSWNNQVELKLQFQLEQADIHKCSTQVHALQLNYTLPGP